MAIDGPAGGRDRTIVKKHDDGDAFDCGPKDWNNWNPNWLPIGWWSYCRAVPNRSKKLEDDRILRRLHRPLPRRPPHLLRLHHDDDDDFDATLFAFPNTADNRLSWNKSNNGIRCDSVSSTVKKGATYRVHLTIRSASMDEKLVWPSVAVKDEEVAPNWMLQEKKVIVVIHIESICRSIRDCL